MTARPRLLDLYCGAGGAAMGYHRAGFDVVGVDIEPQPRYPFAFVRADALTFPLDGFDAVHASPPCQRFAKAGANRGLGDDHPDLLTPTRTRLREWGGPYVIENVPTAPMPTAILLCGSTFGLPIVRHRLFETSPSIGLVPSLCHQSRWARAVDHGPGFYPYARGSWEAAWREHVLPQVWPWMTLAESGQAIPPDYTEHIGRELMRALQEQQHVDRPTPPPTEMPWVREDRCDLCGGPGPLVRVQLEPSSGSWRTHNYRAPRVAYVCVEHGDTAGVEGPAPAPPHRTAAPGTTTLHPQTEHLL